jgi:DNA-binding transcriptional MocR family regulator
LLLTIFTEANWKEGCFRGETILPGQWATSVLGLSQELGFARTTVQRALADLATDGVITVENMGNRWTRITPVNWQCYQPLPRELGQPAGNQRATDGQPTGIIKEVKNINTPTLSSLRSERASPTAKTFPQEFLDFWAAYPKKTGKDAAYRAWQTKKRERRLPAIDDLLEAVRKAKASSQWQEDGGKYIPNPSTWLNQVRWEDEAVEDSAPRGKPLYLRDPDFWRKTQ